VDVSLHEKVRANEVVIYVIAHLKKKGVKTEEEMKRCFYK